MLGSPYPIASHRSPYCDNIVLMVAVELGTTVLPAEECLDRSQPGFDGRAKKEARRFL